MSSAAGMIRPPNQIKQKTTKVLVKDNGSKHYMPLGMRGCSAWLNCPPGYYCPIGNGPCKKAKYQ